MSQDESEQSRLRAEAAELKWADAVEQRRATEARLRLLEAAARAVVTQWDAVLPSIQGAEGLAHIHGWRYDGPQGGLRPQMDSLRAALEPSPAGGPSPAT